MDFNRLCELATKATGNVLRYHSGQNIVHDGGLSIMVRKEIDELYHLRDMAQDTSVADLEIACDAAVSIAEAYNRAPQEPSFQDTTLRRLRPERSGVAIQPKINLRWFYICVQGLLLVDIKPELLLDGKVDRLPHNPQQQQPSSQSDTEENARFSPTGSKTLTPDSSPSPAPSPEPPVPSSSGSGSGSAKGASPKLPKAKWEDDEIQLMVRLKASGMRHCDVAARLGRGLGSVENKYGRIMQQDEWKVYLTEVESGLQQKGKRRG